MIQARSQRSLLQRRRLAAKVLAFVLAVCYVPAVEGGLYYRDHFISCQGRSLYPQYYAVLSRVCDDCTNLFRENSVYVECRENCFRNQLFDTCMSALMIMTDTQKEYREYATFIQEGKK